MEPIEDNQYLEEPQTNKEKIFSKKAIILIIILSIATILAFLFESLLRSPETTVKEYIKALNNCDTDKLVDLMDSDGAIAFSKCSSDLSKFDNLYEEQLNQTSDSEKKDINKDTKDLFNEQFQSAFKLLKLMNIKYSVKNVESQKIKNSNKLTKVTCTIVVKNSTGKTEKDVVFYTVKKGLKNYIVLAEL